jgi:hypothetical protein
MTAATAIELLRDANAKIEAALALLEGSTPPTPEPPSGKIVLENMIWAGKIVQHPTGIPAGPKYGEGERGARRNLQWWYPTFILHAWFAKSIDSITGSDRRCVWYHFTVDDPKPSPMLSAYKWRNTAKTPEGGHIFYKWSPA